MREREKMGERGRGVKKGKKREKGIAREKERGVRGREKIVGKWKG